MKIFKKVAAIALGITALAGITACSIIAPTTKNTEPTEKIAYIEDSYTEPISEDISNTDTIIESTEDITSDNTTDISDNTDTDTDYTSESDDIYTDSDDTDIPESDCTEEYTDTQSETFTVSNTETTVPEETVIPETASHEKSVTPEPDLIKSENNIAEDYKVKSDITYETSDKNASKVTIISEGDDLVPVIPEEAINIAALLPTVVVTETIDYLEVLEEEDTSEPVPDSTVTEEATEEVIATDNTIEETVEKVTDENNTEKTIAEETVEDATKESDIIENDTIKKVSEEVTVEDTTVEDNTIEDTVTDDNTVEDTIVEDNTTTEEPVIDEVVEDTTTEEKITNDTVVEDTVVEEPIDEKTVTEETVIEDTVDEDTVEEETVVEDTQPEEPELQEETTPTLSYTPSYELSPEATELYSWIVENTLNPAGKVSYTKQVSNQTYAEATDAVEADYFKYSAGPFTSWSSYSGTALDSDLSYEYMLKDEFIRTNIQNIENQIFYEGISQEDAIAAINNWFKTNYSYKYGIYDMYTALENNGGVCMTYAMIAQALCNDIGIDCYYITGEADNGVEKGGHAWNKVNINNKWYYIDFTWNTSPKYYLSESLWEDHWETGCQKLFV